MAEKADKIPKVDCIMLINPATGNLEMITPDPKRKSSKLNPAETTPKSAEEMEAWPKTKKHPEESSKAK